MTPASKWRIGVIITTLLALVIVAALLKRQSSKAVPLSLVFERYSTRSDFYFEDVAFLWLTNSSTNSYYLAMTGNTNTRHLATPVQLGGWKGTNGESVMVDCAFTDQTPTGRSNWQQRVSFTNATQCLALGPYSAIRLRVPLPLQGEKRKVAALCAELPNGVPPLLNSSFGRTVLRVLPRPIRRKLVPCEITVQKVWCDHELSPPDEASKRILAPTVPNERNL